MQTSNRGGNSVYMEVRFWYDETDGAIHMTAPDVPNFSCGCGQRPGVEARPPKPV